MLSNDILSCPVKEVSGVWCFKRHAGQHTVANSTTYHLLHYFVKGSAEIVSNGKRWKVASGETLYYYGQEEVRNYYFEDTTFYSVAFDAPELKPLAISQRHLSAEKEINDIFERLHNIYIERNSQTGLNIFITILELLLKLGFADFNLSSYTAYEQLWNKIEIWIRKKNKFRVSNSEICKIFNLSSTTLHRTCKNATGKSVSKRLKQLRMGEAKSLLRFSELNISEIAQYLGYPRIHEFSREFSAYFNQTASSYKNSK